MPTLLNFLTCIFYSPAKTREYRSYPFITANHDKDTSLPSPCKSNPSLKFLSKVGRGAFGQVYKVEDSTDLVNPICAVKCVDVRNKLFSCPRTGATRISSKETMNLFNEIVVLNKLNFDHVVRYFACWGEDDADGCQILDEEDLESTMTGDTVPLGSAMSIIFIKMELCHFTLHDFMGKKVTSQVSNGHLLGIAHDVGVGLKYIHDKGYIHRDIKPVNIFCKSDPAEGCTWKIGDLGLAVGIKAEGNFGKVGTELYWSPEMKRELSYTTKTDEYSLGLVFLKLVQGQENKFGFWSTSTKLHELSGSAKRRRFLRDIIAAKYRSWGNVIHGLLDPDPRGRLGCDKLDKALGKIKI